ncbi:MAG TPA: hypothetical protein VM123_13505 [archaeon]|nr:hypothetical protein [archaeon]
MDKQHKITQLYGYAVCLVTVITFLISVSSFVGAIFDLSDPMHGGYYPGGPSLASFENYKMDILKAPQQGQQASATAYVPDDQTLKAMYEAAKADRIQTVKLRAQRTLAADILIVALCIALFTFHWRWMRRLAREEA